VTFDPSLPDDRGNVSGTHPVREALVLVGGIAGAGVALALLLALLVEWVVPLVPPAFEARIFGARWADLSPAADTGETDARGVVLQSLVDRLARHWPENPYVLRARAWEEPTPNALAFPGGRILVTTGLLDAVASENELAFVLAHEIGHFRYRDHLRGMGRGVAFGLVMTGLGLSGAGGASQLASIAGGLATRGFDRDQERAADAFGLALVQAEYGHVGGAFDLFDRLPEPGGAVPRRLASYLATHPLGAERVAALHALARERGYPEAGPMVELAWP
jgi:Zn-dependent protease with chaperone function